jgi:hypothetical protein
MTSEDQMRGWFMAVEVMGDYTEAVVVFRDGSRLGFCHRVGERWAKASDEGTDHQAGQVLAWIKMFRLNAKHLDIQFSDGSRWEFPFRQQAPGADPA